MRAALVVFALIALANAIAPLHLKSGAVPDSYIVVFKDTVAADTLTSDLAFLKSTLNITYDYTYSRVLKGFSGRLTKTQLVNVRIHPNIDYIEQNQIATTGQCTTQARATWGINRISEKQLLLNGDYKYVHTGTGVDAYIFDTGILTTHTEFAGRATFDWKAENSWVSTDDNGHGTHVASTVAGTTYGVAKKANLYAYKVLGGDGSGTYAGIIAGLEAAVKMKETRKRPSTGNMSLGGGFSAAVNAAVDKTTHAGIFMVVAAGNSNQDACYYSPASAAAVLCVGATDTGNVQGAQVDIRSDFSNFGTCLSLFAPGSDITGAWINSNTATLTISGTSMASPHVCGAVAKFLEGNPTASWPQVESSIISAGTPGTVRLNCGTSTCNNSPNVLLFSGCN